MTNELIGVIEDDSLNVIVQIAESGPRGDKGDQGKDGYTPIKGIDYFDGEQGIPGIDGKNLEFVWNGTQLGIRQEGQSNYTYVNLKGDKGDTGSIGATGKSIEFTWSGTQLGVRQEGQTTYQYIDLKGDVGHKGEKGDTGEKGDPFVYDDFTPTQLEGLKGPQGIQGLQGSDGYTPVKGVDYFDGEKGPQGEKGDPGQDGYTPVKGVDYFDGEKGEKGDPGSDANVTETNIVAALGFTPVSSSRVLTDVPIDAEFTDTVTTINGKTGAISKADIVALGIPAQDTDTTYTEITTAEIDAGTASTLRAITARRLKYLLDKIVALFPSKTSELTNDSGFLTSVTKSDVGLGNVDNIKQMPISNGVLENYREKLVTLSGTSTTINLSLGNVFTQTLTGNTTYSITNAVSGQAHSFTLIITQTATVRTLTFPANVKWSDGEIPDMSTPLKEYELFFTTTNGGGSWRAGLGGVY